MVFRSSELLKAIPEMWRKLNMKVAFKMKSYPNENTSKKISFWN